MSKEAIVKQGDTGKALAKPEPKKQYCLTPLGVENTEVFRLRTVDKCMDALRQYVNHQLVGDVGLEMLIDDEGIAHPTIIHEDLIRIEPGNYFIELGPDHTGATYESARKQKSQKNTDLSSMFFFG